MKTFLPQIDPGGAFERILKIVLLLGFVCKISTLQAQCPGGYTAAQLNWDNMDYLPSTGVAYTGFYLNASVPFSQNFAVGPARLNISYNNSANLTLNGDNGTNTAHAGSFSTAGDDVQITTGTTASRTMILDFNANVANVQFSIFDLDQSMIMNITAVNASGFSQLITVTSANAGSGIIVVGSGTVTVTATAPGTSYANNDNNGTINVSIAGPVKTINVAFSNATGEFWLGDIDACVTGSFPTNYFTNMQPFTGQPTYIIGTSDTNTVSLINLSTGQAKMIFQDASSPRYINGLGYDHNRHELYYVIDFTTSPSTNMALKKYNFVTNTITTVVNDVRTIGIPTFQRGVESAGCAWYDNALYFGIEGNGSSSRENIVWRIDFDASGNITTTTQVYAKGSSAHDWGDFGILDGIFYDFNSGAGTPQYMHYNMMTGQVLNSYTGMPIMPRQTGVTWNNQLYWVYDSLALYNMDGTIGPRTRITGTTVLDWTGYCGDATGFRPQSDFGDAPASYDPVALSPALHMMDTTLRLGPTFDQEFTKMGVGPLADADGADEDAIATVNVLDTATTNYLADVTVYNNTGANATLIGWLDINGNGTFEAGEGRSYTVPSSTALQTITVSWLGINTPLSWGQWTYMRIRLTRAANGMTTANPTGYFPDGEVEDYLVWTVNTLPVKLLSFQAAVQNNQRVVLDWEVENEKNMQVYEVERSSNGVQWSQMGSVPARVQPGTLSYQLIDETPLKGKSYYRLKQVELNGKYTYSETRQVSIKQDPINISIYPNPVNEQSTIRVQSMKAGDAVIQVFNDQGSLVWKKNITLQAGMNQVQLDINRLATGAYTVKVETENESKTTRFIRK